MSGWWAQDPSFARRSAAPCASTRFWLDLLPRWTCKDYQLSFIFRVINATIFSSDATIIFWFEQFLPVTLSTGIPISYVTFFSVDITPTGTFFPAPCILIKLISFTLVVWFTVVLTHRDVTHYISLFGPTTTCLIKVAIIASVIF